MTIPFRGAGQSPAASSTAAAKLVVRATMVVGICPSFFWPNARSASADASLRSVTCLAPVIE